MDNKATLIDRIHTLTDKQACYIAKSITQEIFTQLPSAPSFDELGTQMKNLASDASIKFDLNATPEWYATEISAEISGQIARLLLETLATQSELVDLVDQAIDRYEDESLDLGIISVGVAVALVYVAISGNVEVDLGWFKFKKRGLNSKQQKEVVEKTLPQVVKAFVGGINPNTTDG